MSEGWILLPSELLYAIDHAAITVIDTLSTRLFYVWGNLLNFSQDLYGGIQGRIAAVQDAITSWAYTLSSEILDRVTSMWNDISSKQWKIINDIWSSNEQTRMYVNDAKSAIVSQMGNFYNRTVDAIASAQDVVAMRVSSAVNQVSSFMSNASREIAKKIDDTMGGISDFLSGLWGEISDLFRRALEAIIKIGEAIVALWEALKNEIKDLPNLPEQVTTLIRESLEKLGGR